MGSEAAVGVGRPIVWALVVAVAMLVGTPSTEAQSPLQIVLDAPETCEAEVFFRGPLPDPLVVRWQVSGGEPPYEVLIDGKLHEGATGAVERACGSSIPGARTSGPITIQAAVTDGAGRRASALADIYALRVFDRSAIQENVMPANETYRVHQLLLTIPPGEEGREVRVGGLVSGDCERWGPECDDRFPIWYGTPSGAPLPSIWIQRWTGAEYGRSLDGEPVVREEIDEEALTYEQREANSYFDELLSLIGQPPRRYQVTQPRSGPDDPNLRLTMYAPSYCLMAGGSFYQGAVDVSWEVEGGRGPFEVTIAGQRYLGQSGRARVSCYPRKGYQVGGHQRVQGTVVDADGRISSGRADMYAIGWVHSREDGTSAGLPYRIREHVMIIPPEWGDTVSLAEERESTNHCWIDDGGVSRCENALRHTFTDGNATASFLFGVISGTVFERTPRDETSAVLNDMIDRLLGSLGQPPPLPDGFLESNAPLQLSAFFEPAVCEYESYGGNARLHWTASGGRWWPLTVTIDGEEPQFGGSQPSGVRCDHDQTDRMVTLRVSEYGASPVTTELQIPFVTRWVGDGNRNYAGRRSSLKQWLIDGDGCATNERLTIRPRFVGDPGPTSEITAYDGMKRWSGSTVSCAEQPGWMLVTAQEPSSGEPQRLIELSYALRVRQAQPERSAE